MKEQHLNTEKRQLSTSVAKIEIQWWLCQQDTCVIPVQLTNSKVRANQTTLYNETYELQIRIWVGESVYLTTQLKVEGFVQEPYAGGEMRMGT